jgi:hypothetical protein
MLLRPLVSVNNDFLKFFIFKVLKKLFKKLTSLRVCSGLYAYAQGTGAHAEHARQELMRMLSIRISLPIFQMAVLYTKNYKFERGPFKPC